MQFVINVLALIGLVAVAIAAWAVLSSEDSTSSRTRRPPLGSGATGGLRRNTNATRRQRELDDLAHRAVIVRLQQDAAALEAARTMQAIARSLRKD
mgnify:CR=1 FL=1